MVRLDRPARTPRLAGTRVHLRVRSAEHRLPAEPEWSAEVGLDRLGHYQSISLLTDESGEVFLVGQSGQKKGRIEVYALGDALAAPADWVRNTAIDVDVSPADFSAGGCVGVVHGAVCLTAVSRFCTVKSRKLTKTQLLPPLLA